MALRSKQVIRPLEHQAQWWPADAYVHVIKTHPDPLLAGKSLPVCHGRLVVCRYVRCKAPSDGCNSFGVSIRVFDPESQFYDGQYCTKCGTEGVSPIYGRTYCPDCGPGSRTEGRHVPGVIPITVCMASISRKRKRGYRWCGHKTSEGKCYCAQGFSHLKSGEW